METTKRLPLYIGLKCNCNCQFCYYLSALNQDHYPYEAIVAQLEKYKKHKIHSVDITGGEPTIHKDIIKIIRTCVQMGFKDISMITNGIALKKESYVDEFIAAGVSTFVLSLHGHCAEIHDCLTNRAGSFDTLIKLMRYLKSRDIRFSVNMVVNNRNYQYLAEYARLLSGIGVTRPVTFLVMNPLGDGKINFNNLAVNYSAAAVQMKKAIDIFTEHNIVCTWKFMPLCVGHDILKHTNNIYQFFFDPYDWDYPTQFWLSNGSRKYLTVLFKNFSLFNKAQLNSISFRHLRHLAVLKENFNNCFIKIEPCQDCKYYYVCDGISPNYLEIFGKEEFKAIAGEKLINPVEVLHPCPQPNPLERLVNHAFALLSQRIYAYILSKKS